MLEAWEQSQQQAGNENILAVYLSSLIAAKKYQQAQTYASKYIDGEFAALAYTYLGIIQISLEDKEKALDYFYKSLEKAGSNDNLIMTVLNEMSPRFDSKVISDWCNSKLEKDSESIAANMALFRLYQKDNDHDKALKYINKCLDIVGKTSDQWINFSNTKAMHLTLAYMKTAESRYMQQAIVSYEDMLEASPNNTDIMNNLAYLLADNNQKNEDAVKYAQTAHEAQPNNTTRMDTYAYALYRVGNHEKAEELLLSIIAIHEQRNTPIDDWGVYKHLAMVQEAFDKKLEAIKYYNQALEAAGDNIPAKEKERLENEIARLMNN